MIVPRYKELSVKCIWEKIKKIPEFTVYFPDFAENQLPEREYLIAIISTLNHEATQTIVDEARKIRSVEKSSNNDELVAISSKLLEEIRSIKPQKSMNIKFDRILISFMIILQK